MNRIVNALNPQQWKLLGSLLFSATGPLAWLAQNRFGMSSTEVAKWVEVYAIFSPLVGGIFAMLTQTNNAQMQAVATMPLPAKMRAMDAVQAPGLADIALALPDVTLVKAASYVPGVQVHVDGEEAPPPVVALSKDENVRDVVEMIGGPRFDPEKAG